MEKRQFLLEFAHNNLEFEFTYRSLFIYSLFMLDMILNDAKALSFTHENHMYMKVKVKVTQSCPTLCDPKNYSAHGIIQARILEWVAFPFSRGSSQPRN